MKVNTNVKAGGIQQQHNEKLAGDKKTKRFTLKTGVKSGGGHGKRLDMPNQHNEKLADDSINTIEQKRFGKKLRLSKETIRQLKDGDLKWIIGGVPATWTQKGDICRCALFYTI